MAGRYNRWLRAKLADRIRANGGYHAGRSGSFALSWCVRYYLSLDGADAVTAALIKHGYVLNEADLQLRAPDLDTALHSPTAYYQAYENAMYRLQEELHEYEGLWSPETARRYGFDYVGCGAERPFDMALEGYGGGGKHVCLTRFEGQSLLLRNRELAEAVENHLSGGEVPNRWCRALMGIMDELDSVLTEENAKEQGNFYEADWFANELGLID